MTINKASSRKTIATIAFLSILICVYTYDILFESISSIRHLYLDIGKFVTETNFLFGGLIVTLCLSILWNAKRNDIFLFISGQVLIILGMYNPLTAPKAVLIALQSIGIIQLLLSSIRMLLFLLSKKGYGFIELKMSKKN